jgi:hypothetical protein
MNTGRYVFSQLLDFVNKYEFDKIVKQYSGNYRARKLNSWNHFLQLLFGQITGLNSINCICICLKAHRQNLYRLGIRQAVNVSTLSRAGESRDWHIFADFGNWLIKFVRPMYAKCPVTNIDINNEIFALDSTSISCSINLLVWAEGKYSRGAVKMHTLVDMRGSIPAFIHITDGKYHDSNALDEITPLENAIYLMDKAYVDFAALYRFHSAGAFFVTRAKDTMRFEVVEQNFNIDENTGLRSDKTVFLSIKKSKRLYPDELRLVEFYDIENNELLVFLTNNLEISALEVANLYKNRWQIEVFFKWIKQNLTVKKFWGHSENAVRIQLWVVIIAYLLVAYVKHALKSEYSIYEIMQILSVSAFDKTPIRELLANLQADQNITVPECNLFDNM